MTKARHCLLLVSMASLSIATLGMAAQSGKMMDQATQQPMETLADGAAWEDPDRRGLESGFQEDKLAGSASNEFLREAASRATFSVGSDGNCDFATVAQALNSPLVSGGDVLNLRSDLVTMGTTDIRDRPGSLTLRGGFETCSSPTPTAARTVFNGNGERVFYLQAGANYTDELMEIHLENIDIINGHASGNFGGGGIMIAGRVGSIAVQLRNVNINNNSTTWNGGGISVRVNSTLAASGGFPMLIMDNSSLLSNNEADRNGGGLSCWSPADRPQATMIRLGTVAIANNQANNGGGLAIDGCDQVVLYPGVFLLGVFGNTANGEGENGNGGGIYVTGSSARVRLLSNPLFEGLGDPNNGGAIDSNNARRGAGLYVGGGGHLDSRDIHFRNNSASVIGGGVYVEGNGSLVEIDRELGLCRPGTPGLFGLERCSVVSGNSGGNWAGALAARDGGEIRVQGTRIINNSSAQAAIANTGGNAGDSLIRIENSVIWGNQSFWGVVSTHGTIELRFSTVADNNITSTFFRAGAPAGNIARVNIYGSIVRESGTTADMSGDGDAEVRLGCVIGWQPASEVQALLTFYMNEDPQFVNPADRDYRTGPASPAIDFCDDRYGPPSSDFNRISRGTQHVGDPFDSNNPGVGFYDVGAFETRWRTDMLFRSRFQFGGG